MPRLLLRLLLAALFLFAGTVHLVNPRFFLPIMPPFIPAPTACIVISGVAELIGGIGLLIPGRRVQVATGWWLLLLLLAVFPANIYMATAHIRIHGFPAHAWMAWVRVALQPVLMGMVAWATGAWSGKCNMGGRM